MRPRNSSVSRRNMAATRSAVSPLRAARTRKPTWCKSWCERALVTITSTPAPGYAIRPPATGSRTLSENQPVQQNFDSVMKADVIFVIGANPTDGHPVFGSQMKRRLRQGAKLIVADPRRIDLVRTAHIAAEQHLKLRPGTNVALINSLAHVIVTEGLVKEDFVRERCEIPSFEKWRQFVMQERNSPEAMQAVTGVPAAEVRAAARAVRDRGQRRDLLRSRRHRA